MGYLKYFTRKRARFKSLSGEIVNIPYGTQIQGSGNSLYYEGKLLTRVSCKNGKDYFVQDDDGNGKKRAELINKIVSKLGKNDKFLPKRWDKVWADEICNQYKRKNMDDYWLWDRSFYDAPIFILQHIANLVCKE